MYSLQNYTTYSIKSGIGQPEDWAQRAKELGYQALGICDKTTMAGIIEFQKECDKRDIHPILGQEFLVTSDATVKDKNRKSDIRGILILYAKDQRGLENLISLNNFSTNREDGGFYYYPRIDTNVLSKYSEGVICVVPVEDGYGRELDSGTVELADSSKIYDLYKTFGDDLYIGVNPMTADKSAQRRNKSVIRTFGDKLNRVFTFNCHFTDEDKSHLYEVVRGMDRRSHGQKESLDRDVSSGYMPSFEELEEITDYYNDYLWDVFDECVENLEKISKDCNVKIELGTYHMPEMEAETGSVKGDLLKKIGEGFKQKLCPQLDNKIDTLTSLDQLHKLKDKLQDFYSFESVRKGEVSICATDTIEFQVNPEFEGKLKTLDKYVDRLLYEFEIIEELGYLEYFHIIDYICKYIDDQGLGRGFARGSAGGSIVSYLLNITQVDPIRHGLLFERFLNPDRQDLPDIDLDFSVEARKEIKRHVRQKWGEDHVCNIGAFGRLKVKSAIKKVSSVENYSIPDNSGRYIQYSFNKLTDILKSTNVPAVYRGKKELRQCISSSDKFKEFYNKHSKWFKEVIMPLQDMVVNKQIHAAGTLITKKPLDESVPVYEHSNGELVAQWSDRHCEEAGNPKFDFLTVEGVNVAEFAAQLIEQRHDEELPAIEDIPLNDEKTMEVFTKVNTRGIFQFRTHSQREFFKILKPTKFEELVAAVALVRPGPLSADAHIEFADIKHGRAKPEYPHPDLKPILEETYGILIYQEQVMEIAKVISNFTGAEADYLRKAAGKKKIKEMEKWEDEFKSRGIDNGYDEGLVEDLWEKIVAFAEYGFNKSHSVAYTLLSYYQAYIKSRYNVEFWPAVLKYSKDDSDEDASPQKLKHLVKSYGIDIVYPTIYGFAPDFEPAEEEDAIYWPIDRIKGIGDSVVNQMCKGGRRSFESIEDLIESTDSRIVHKGVIGKLIKAGFFDPIDKPWNVAKEYYKIREKNGRNDDGIPPDLKHKKKVRWYMARNEVYQMTVKPWKEVADFHPNVQTISNEMLKACPNGRKVFIGGYVDDVWFGTTKYNNLYARLTVVDEGEDHNVILWPGFYESSVLHGKDDDTGRFKRPYEGQIIELTGEKDEYNGRPQIVCNSPKSYLRIIWDEMDELVEKFGER